MDLNDDDQGDDLDLDLDLDAEAKRRALYHGGQGAEGGPSFPRGSGRFVLSDGGPARWTAFELQRIAGLGLEELKFGTKVRAVVFLYVFCARETGTRMPPFSFTVSRELFHPCMCCRTF